VPRPNDRSHFHAALDEAYRHRHGAVRAITAKGGEDSADLVQDAFLRTVEAGQASRIGSPLGFVMRVARNGVVDTLRRRARWAKLESEAIRDDRWPDPSPDAERRLIASERLQRALACIDAMPPRRREVFLLHRLEGLTYGKIAKRLGISRKTVEDHMSTAMLQLSRGMDQYDGDGD
jgi:RNA polymerase sigma-70 factor (ECF subfamily)